MEDSGGKKMDDRGSRMDEAGLRGLQILQLHRPSHILYLPSSIFHPLASILDPLSSILGDMAQLKSSSSLCASLSRNSNAACRTFRGLEPSAGPMNPCLSIESRILAARP